MFICAWCDEEIKGADGIVYEDNETVCAECYSALEAQMHRDGQRLAI